MFDELHNRSSSSLRRRESVGGVASLAAASAFSVSVSESAAARVEGGDDGPGQTLASPDGSVEVAVDVTDGVPSYSVSREGTTAVEESTLGFEFEEQAPLVMDLVTGAGIDQSAALSYSSAERATLPYASLGGSESGDEREAETESGGSD